MKNKIYPNFFTAKILIALFLVFAVSFSEESAEELFNTALKFQKSGQLDQAEQYYKASLKLKSDVDAMYNLGILYEDKNNYTDIYKIIEDELNAHKQVKSRDLDIIMDIDREIKNKIYNLYK